MSFERKNQNGSSAADNAAPSVSTKEAGARNIQDTLRYLSAAFDELTTYKDFKGEKTTTKSMSAFLLEEQKGDVSKKNLKDFLETLSGMITKFLEPPVRSSLEKIIHTKSKEMMRSEVKSSLAETPQYPAVVFYSLLLELAKNSKEENFSKNVDELVAYMGSSLGVKEEEFHENVNKKMKNFRRSDIKLRAKARKYQRDAKSNHDSKDINNDKYQRMFDDSAFFKSGLDYLNEAFAMLCALPEFKIDDVRKKTLSDFFEKKLKSINEDTFDSEVFLAELISTLKPSESADSAQYKAKSNGTGLVRDGGGEAIFGDPVHQFIEALYCLCVAAENKTTQSPAAINTEVKNQEGMPKPAPKLVGSLFSLAVKNTINNVSKSIADNVKRGGDARMTKTAYADHRERMADLAYMEECGEWAHKSDNLMAYVNAIKLMELCITNQQFGAVVSLNTLQRENLAYFFTKTLEQLNARNDDFDIFPLLEVLRNELIGILVIAEEERNKNTAVNVAIKHIKEFQGKEAKSLLTEDKKAVVGPLSDPKLYTPLEVFAWYMVSAIQDLNLSDKKNALEDFLESIRIGIDTVFLFLEKKSFIHNRTTYRFNTAEDKFFQRELIYKHRLTFDLNGLRDSLKYIRGDTDVRSKYVFDALKILAKHLPDSVRKNKGVVHTTIRNFERLLNDPESEGKYYSALLVVKWLLLDKLEPFGEKKEEAVKEKLANQPHYKFYEFVRTLIDRLDADLDNPHIKDQDNINIMEVWNKSKDKLTMDALSEKAQDELEALTDTEIRTIRRSDIGLR